MRSLVYAIAHLFGFEKDPDSPSNSEDDDDWGDDNPRITMIKEQLEYYFSGINLETDKNFRKEIGRSEDGSIDIEYFLKCNRIKLLKATPEEILEAAHWSQYLEADDDNRTIRSKEPFHSDPERFRRIIKVSGLGKKVPQYAQYEFFNSIFPGEIDYIYLNRKEENGQLEYTNESFVEFSTAERVKEILDNGIVYGSGNELLDIEPYSPSKNRKDKHKKKHHHVEEEEENEQEPEFEQDPELLSERDVDQEEEHEPEAEAEAEPEPETPPEPEKEEEKPTPRRTPKKRGPKGRAGRPSAKE